MNAYKIAEAYRGTREIGAITDFYSLPFDEEIKRQEVEEMERMANEAAEIYRQAVEAGYFNANISNN